LSQPVASGHGTAQSEYQAIYGGATEGVWLRYVLEELGCRQQQTQLNCDNQPAIDFSNNPINQSRMKSIDIKFHAIRDFIRERKIYVRKIAGQYQLADIFTKPLSATPFQLQRSHYLTKVTR
jgi:hypothetical protein